ncbi:MAG: hypothetical protein UV61_C0002G0011 [Candidatus Gottesmanbacteria bacterium GW2011_GWB1_43_11]|uniref:Uncharacterized protein n=1 Tax=Candidatus Gottesmanbacteria bacterium GW2011_GWB1_43_11 TaxID=1618446 RepID=A0A0G1CNG0_9BACT|nr:MAG: hypothetical protein UV04_C0025G0011 [Candidatus Gottesmanbacteria bacterium GW2011_GWA2_42_16]KKS54267.1 MAG: hypothetical protein UV17_C0022G0008 [Candidatus Gottesmanbacteria bacterium GW2011_GWA1_42_26]KKS81304.1 MAG: hypothetical protein UV55_C0016G0010 [Candidatus Gottesmanbacteria bacterium GW2011_GWC1_43_10]KKS87290.1 MAG: hypothetical protein UV61_C0002G0011 [Candidatus Gottesmanbacteria bacterium GW2011_GWB1_43_11]
MNNTQSLWTILREVSGYAGVGHCWVWTSLATETLMRGGIKLPHMEHA